MPALAVRGWRRLTTIRRKAVSFAPCWLSSLRWRVGLRVGACRETYIVWCGTCSRQRGARCSVALHETEGTSKSVTSLTEEVGMKQGERLRKEKRECKAGGAVGEEVQFS